MGARSEARALAQRVERLRRCDSCGKTRAEAMEGHSIDETHSAIVFIERCTACGALVRGYFVLDLGANELSVRSRKRAQEEVFKAIAEGREFGVAPGSGAPKPNH